MRTVWIIAGEESGDQYGARLASEICHLAPGTVIKGMGGHAMAEAGVDILVDSTELGVIGFVEVFKHLPVIHGVFKNLVSRAENERPDAVVLIDYPGFNLRFARQMHRRGIRVVYYISPQVWAWKKGRIPKIATWVDHLMCIFPFEPEVYQGTELRAEFIGHPLVETLAELRDPQAERDPNSVALLPGSRRGEIDRLLEPLLRTAYVLSRDRPELRFTLPLPRQAIAEYARRHIVSLDLPADMPSIDIQVGTTRHVMQTASAGIAASGTVTIEAGILGLPLVVVYKLNWLTYQLAKLLVKVPHFTMVNLVAGRELFQEFLQDDVCAEKLAPALLSILPGGSRHQKTVEELARAIAKLGGRVPASRRAAEIVLEVASSSVSA